MAPPARAPAPAFVRVDRNGHKGSGCTEGSASTCRALLGRSGNLSLADHRAAARAAETGPHAGDLYQIAVDLSDATPHGGWTLGIVVRYHARGHNFAILAYSGYAIGISYRSPKYYDSLKAVDKTFKIKTSAADSLLKASQPQRVRIVQLVLSGAASAGGPMRT